MLWFLLVISSTVLGNFIIRLITGKNFALMLHISISWLIGVFATSFSIYIFNFIFPLNGFFALLIICSECFLCYKIREFMKLKHQKSMFKISIEKYQNIYLLCFLFSIIAIVHLWASYIRFPNKIPKMGMEIFDTEKSFISSLRYGINRRRKNIFFYEDPMVHKQYFNLDCLALIYMAALDSLGAGYEEASVFVCFLNIIVTTNLIYYFAKDKSKNALLISLCFMLNGGWAFYRFYFGSKCNDTDFLHTTCSGIDIPWYQTLGFVLSYSKSASFTVPMILAIHVLMQNRLSQKHIYRNKFCILAGVIAIFMPNLMGSISVFLFYSCFSEYHNYFMPFALSILPKLIHSKLRNYPIWRETQMKGLFFSPIRIIINSLGPMFITSIFPFLTNFTVESIHKSSVYLSCYIILLIIRNGNDAFENIVAITGLILPFFCVSFLNSLHYILILAKNKILKGFVQGIIIFTFITFIAGGIISIISSEKNLITGLNQHDIKCGNWIKKNIPSNEVILTEGLSLDPSVFIAGRQIISGNLKELWKRGANIFNSYLIVKEVKESDDLIGIMERESIHYILCLNFSKICRQSESQINRTVFKNEKWTIYHI